MKRKGNEDDHDWLFGFGSIIILALIAWFIVWITGGTGPAPDLPPTEPTPESAQKFAEKESVERKIQMIQAASRSYEREQQAARLAAIAERKAAREEARAQAEAEETVVASAPSGGTVWDDLAQCESGGNWSYNGSSGYDGGLQFLPSTWSAVAPNGFPAYAWQATREQQIVAAEILLKSSGWGAWPACSAELGL